MTTKGNMFVESRVLFPAPTCPANKLLLVPLWRLVHKQHRTVQNPPSWYLKLVELSLLRFYGNQKFSLDHEQF